MSILARLCLGILGVIFSVSTLVSIFDGSLTFEGRYGWLMPFLGIVFIVYALGGQQLLRKYFPILAEKEKLDNEKLE